MYTAPERLPDPQPEGSSRLGRNDPGWYRGKKVARWSRLGSIAIDWWPIGLIWEYVSPWVAVPLLIVNQVWVQGTYGGTVGKLACGQRIVCGWINRQGRQVWTRPDPLRLSVRLLLHILDSICFIGVFRMLWNDKGQTPADSWVNTVVLQDQEAREVWREMPESVEEQVLRDPVLSDWMWRWHLQSWN